MWKRSIETGTRIARFADRCSEERDSWEDKGGQETIVSAERECDEYLFKQKKRTRRCFSLPMKRCRGQSWVGGVCILPQAGVWLFLFARWAKMASGGRSHLVCIFFSVDDYGRSNEALKNTREIGMTIMRPYWSIKSCKGLDLWFTMDSPWAWF